jgi:hypothetical protein
MTQIAGASGPARRHAVTLIEAVLFISVALGLIVGGLVFYRQAYISSEVTETSRIVTAAVTASREVAYHGGLHDCTGADSIGTILRSGGYMPDNYFRDGYYLNLDWLSRIDEASIPQGAYIYQVSTEPRGCDLSVPVPPEAELPHVQLFFDRSLVTSFLDGAIRGFLHDEEKVCTRIMSMDESGYGPMGADAYYVTVNYFDGSERDHLFERDGALTPDKAASLCNGWLQMSVYYRL